MTHVSHRDLLGFASEAVRSRRLRSGLTILGITIGVTAVITVLGLTDGLDAYVASEVLSSGGRSFRIQRVPDVAGSSEAREGYQKRRPLRVADAAVVRASCELCSEVGVEATTTGVVVGGGRNREGVAIHGVSEALARMEDPPEIDLGRGLLPEDEARGRDVAVVGPDLRDGLFGERPALGEVVRVAGYPLRVVGVTTRRGSIFGVSQDNVIWMAVSTYERIFGTADVVIHVEARSGEFRDEAMEKCRWVLRSRRHLGWRKDDDFAIETGESLLEVWKGISGQVFWATLLVTGISLVVGGVVVMNIMLVSVTERTREIGVRRALGARRADITRQFVAESILLSVIGGALGVVLSELLVAVMAALMADSLSGKFSASIGVRAIAVALGVSGAVGVLAGIYPARRAASLDPAEAMRSD